METDLTLGTTVWIEHTSRGDVNYKVKFIRYRPPFSRETCLQCAKGQLVLMGHLVQYGILDDKIYAVMLCEHCKSVTVFISYVTAQARLDHDHEGYDEKADG